MAFNDCGCKGIRTCLICENATSHVSPPITQQVKLYKYCSLCGTAVYPKYGTNSFHPHGDDDDFIEFSGISIIENFIDEKEEQFLKDSIYKTPFCKSQSGRQKQDYGPKVNFKKQKVKSDVFTGLPDFSQFLYERMKDQPCLKDFIPVELCNLEYVPERGSAIDPHFDDFWLWGERLVTVNLLSDTVLCFTKDDLPEVEVHVPLLQRSLIVVFGKARYEWKHAIHRDDIKQARLAMTFRELTDEFKVNGKSEHIGQALIETALTFKGSAVGTLKNSQSL